MTLTPGTRLGPYEIVAPLGAGGMGEVYRAKDSRLGREVAIKVLPQHLSANPEVRARFEREARTVSALNHPHICVLHDVGREGDTDYLVMELVEGETLAQRLAKEPLSTHEVLKLGVQIAEALGRAHRAGVVHRDLKPGNVMLTKSGAKLMDFGLARATGMAGPAKGSGVTMAALTQSPTIAQPLTSEGTIVGTFQYMAPEQLEGKEADARSDLWALGCVLYETATGKRAFEGASQASLISSIMSSQPPPMATVAPLTPPALDRLVRECLAKDPEERIQSAHDVKLQLEWIRDAGSQAGIPVPVAARRRSRERLGWIASLSVVTLGAVAAVLLLPRAGAGPTTIHASIVPPAGGEFSSTTTNPLPLAVSPDGTQIVFCARTGEGPDMLWARSLDSPDARPLAGTENAEGPFFSPDGRSIGFFASGKLKRVDVTGGPVITLADALDPRAGTWGRDGVILYTPDSEGPVFRVSAEGGPAAEATALDTTLGVSTHRYPVFLPDGRHFLYLARRAGAGAGEEPAIYAASLGSPKRTRVVGVASNVVYASGQLLYVRGGILVAQPFDVGRLATTGPAVPLVDDLRWDERFSRGAFAASHNGVLAFMTGKAQTRTQLLWLDRSGRRLERVGEAADYTYGGTPAISPDGGRAAMAILNPDRGTSDVWIVDLAAGRRRRLTVDDADHPGCAWSHDGKRVVVNFGGGSRGSVPLVLRTVDGPGVDTVLTQPGWLWPSSASPDGRFILYSDGRGRGGSDILAAPASGASPPIPVAAGPGFEALGQFSRDGRLVAYSSNESGRNEVYVVTFPEPGGKWQVSQDGGSEPRWSRDGRELCYVDRENRILSVEVTTSPSGFETGAVRPLFQFHAAGGFWRYDVSPDGLRLLVTVPPEDEASSPVTLMTNWTAKLRKR
jgi:Tol biopolymer transport system component